MNCESIQQLLSAYVDSELTQEEEQLCKEHLETCEVCQETLQLFREIKDNMDVLDQVDLPARFHEDVMKKIKEEPSRHRNRRSIYKWIGSIASIAAVCIGGIILTQPQSVETPMNERYAERIPQGTRSVPGEIAENEMLASEGQMEAEILTNLVVKSSNQESIIGQIEDWAEENLILSLRIELDGVNGLELVGVQDYEAFEVFLSQIQGIESIIEENVYFGNVLTIKFIE